MIGYKELIAVLPKLPAEVYTGTLFRRVNLALQSVEPHQFLYALGAGKEGARFTPRRGPASLYVAEDELSAEAESKQGGFENFRKVAAPPVVVYSLKVSLKAVLDLTDAKIVQKIGSSQAELAAPWRLHRKKAPTQILGLAAFDSGKFDGSAIAQSKIPKEFAMSFSRRDSMASLWLNFMIPTGIFLSACLGLDNSSASKRRGVAFNSKLHVSAVSGIIEKIAK